jgi:dual-specificity kinase
MSTPTTATATLPPYGHSHHYSFSHHSQYPSSYRSANGLVPAHTRLAPTLASAYSTSSSSNAYTGTSNTLRPNGLGISHSANTSTRRARDSTDYEGRDDSNYTTMPAAASVRSTGESQPARKRRRSKEPDWNTFYKNGLPKEIIVIDDSPEPGTSMTAGSRRATNGVNGVTSHLLNGVDLDSAALHLAKKRKRDEVGHYDPVRNNISHNGDTPQQYATPSGSTISSDRTNSAHHTTAATSLGSASSSGNNDLESQIGQKRKRTRQQIANEAKRREYGLSRQSYRPPQQPVKKAPDVHVKVITDVSILSISQSVTYRVPWLILFSHTTTRTRSRFELTMKMAITSLFLMLN